MASEASQGGSPAGAPGGASATGGGGDDGAASAAAATGFGEDERDEDLENRVSWTVNAPLLYDLFIGCSLEWPALSVAWLPDDPADGARLAFGLHTDGSVPHEVVIAELCCDAVSELDADPWQTWSVPNLGSVEAFGCSAQADADGPLRAVARLAHPTEVNRIAPCPSVGKLLATKAASGAVLLFDYKAERVAGVVSPDATLMPKGEASDGFALEWSPSDRRLLATGDNSGRLCIWDVEVAPKVGAADPLLYVAEAHAGAVCATCFSAHEPHSVATVGDDGFLRLWDLRAGTSAPRLRASVSGDEVLSMDWSRHKEDLVATTGKDREVRVWDLRTLKAPLHTLCGHKSDVVAVRWAPFREGLLASCSSDATLMLWDLDIEAPPTDEALEGTSPEMLFAHAGHHQGVSDFAWSSSDEYLMCSVSEDNRLQIWQPSAELYLPGAGEEEDEEGDLLAASNGASAGAWTAEDDDDGGAGPQRKRPRAA